MNTPFEAVKLTDRVYWVGAIDWALRDFHGYSTHRGTTYNAYLVLADTVALIDTVKAPFKDEMLARIASLIDPREIRYIISNHAEMDHSGCLPELLEVVRPEKVFASVMGVKALPEHFHRDWNLTPVKDGETVSVGNMNLTFIETRMLHWPESMFTFVREEALLFSQDAFGMHLASSERFADEMSDGVLECEAAKYFANILMPYSPLVAKLLEKLSRLDIPFRIIAPDHGPMWRSDVRTVLDWYARWAARTPTRKAVIVYDTMWGSTDAMAQAIADGIVAGGARAKVMPLRSSHRSDVATEILDAAALVVGSPTMNNTIYPTVADVLTYLKGLRPRNLVGAAFGSYGWGGEAVSQVEEVLRAMKVELVADGLKIRYVPDQADLVRCRSLGTTIAQRLAALGEPASAGEPKR